MRQRSPRLGSLHERALLEGRSGFPVRQKDWQSSGWPLSNGSRCCSRESQLSLMDRPVVRSSKVRLLPVKDSWFLLVSWYSLSHLLSQVMPPPHADGDPPAFEGSDGYIKSVSFWKKNCRRSTVDTSRRLLRLLDDFHQSLQCSVIEPQGRLGKVGSGRFQLVSDFQWSGHL